MPQIPPVQTNPGGSPVPSFQSFVGGLAEDLQDRESVDLIECQIALRAHDAIEIRRGDIRDVADDLTRIHDVDVVVNSKLVCAACRAG